MFFRVELIAISPEFFLILSIHFLILYGVICTSSSYLNYPILIRNLSWLSIQILFFTGLLNFYNPLSYTLIFNDLLILDEFSSFIKTLIIGSTILIILISIKYNQFEKIDAFEIILLILLSTTGILLLVSSFNFVSIYLAIELQSFCLYILAALNRTSEFSTEAGLKYIILGAFSSGLILFGLSLTYGFTGITNLGDLFQFLSVYPTNIYNNHGINVASVFLLVGLFFKLSAAPFHFWAPDIYQGSLTSITVFFGVVPKIGILALLTRFTYIGFYDIFFSWQALFIVGAISSIFIGTFGAFTQLKFKRLLAYSSIGHMGYMLMGFSCGSFEGIHSTFTYIIIYIIMSLINFIILLGIYKKKNLTRINYIKDLTILKNSNPLIAIAIALVCFSMAGIPPLSGFFSKMFIFIAIVQSSMYVLAILGITTSVISCFYYLRIVKSAFLETNYKWATIIRLDREKAILLSTLTIVVTFLAIFPFPIIYGLQNVLYLVIRNQFDILSLVNI